MKKSLLLFVLVAIALTSWSQQPRPGNATTPQKKPVSPFAEYVGLWTATLEGNPWLRLTLELRGEQLGGALVHARSINLNDNGEVKSVSEEQSTETITEAVVNPDGLLITLKDPDTQETDRYMMKLIQPGKDAADLKLIGQAMPPGMPKPKPWRVVRLGAKPASP
jgi:hypothetical protein